MGGHRAYAVLVMQHKTCQRFLFYAIGNGKCGHCFLCHFNMQKFSASH